MDVGACLAFLAFCRVKVTPSLKVGITLQHHHIALGKAKANRSHLILTKRDCGCAVRRRRFWLKVILGSPRSACQEYISPKAEVARNCSLVLMPAGRLPSAPNRQKLI